MSTAQSPDPGVSQAAKPPVALIAGPTASGKSGLAIALARALESQGRRGVVVNSDSAQVYADLQVLSARPCEEEMAGFEHVLFGAWDGAEACSAADWAAAAKREISRIHADGYVPILVGGTGLYLRTLLEGIAPIPEIAADVRNTVRALSTAEAFAALLKEDPGRAALLNPADSQRIARALEVVRSTGRSLDAWQEYKQGGVAGDIELHPVILLPPRDWLYERCDRRFEQMLKEGAVHEVANLLARRLSPDLPVMRAIGVREIAAFLEGTYSSEDMISAGRQATRNYAKRQYTWFRRQPPELWARCESQNYDIELLFASLLQH